MFTAALFSTARRWKQPEHPFIDEWINELQYVHMVEYYLAVKRHGVLAEATRGGSLGNITLSERHSWVGLLRGHVLRDSICTECPTAGLGEEKGGEGLTGAGPPSRAVDVLWNRGLVPSAWHCECTKGHWTAHFEMLNCELCHIRFTTIKRGKKVGEGDWAVRS